MKPFNLELALVAGDSVVTREGKDVSELTLFESLDGGTLLGVVEGKLRSWNKSGKFGTSEFDLFMKPIKRTVYVNFHSGGIADWYSTHTEALIREHGALAIAVPVEVEF